VREILGIFEEVESNVTARRANVVTDLVKKRKARQNIPASELGRAAP
jgi:hypothetical protein